MNRLQPTGHNLTDDRSLSRAIPLLLFLLCLLVRLPFYFESVIDWDESTFILIGQNLLDGHLPYVQLWDNKPPLTFAFFALTLLLGKSIVTVRVAGTICVFLTAVLTWRIGSRIWGRDAGLVAAIFSVVFISLSPGAGQATMTEIIALVPTMGALLILLAGTSSSRRLFLTGWLLSMATLVRSNLAYLALAVGLVIVSVELRGGLRSLLSRAGAYALGGILPLALVCLPYVVTGNERLFVASVFLAPLAYVQSFSSTEVSSILIGGFDRSNVLLWGGCLTGVTLAAVRWMHFDGQRRYRILMVTAFFLGVEWSIVSTGSFYVHYLIQVIPFMALFAGWSFSVLRRPVCTAPLLILLLVGLVAPARPLLDKYASLANTLAANQPLRSDAGYRIAAYIAANNPSHQPVYMMTDHIVYWLLGMSPITKSVTHPSTIGKEYLLKVFLGPDASSEGEMAALLDKKPLFLVKSESTLYLSGKVVEVLEHSLKADYALVETIDGRRVYRRVQN